MGSKMGAADPNYPKIQGLSRLSRLSYGIAVVGDFFFDGLIVSECQCESTLRASQTSGTLDDFAANRAESFKDPLRSPFGGRFA